MAGDKYNMKNPGVKRILQEVKEMQSNPSDDFMSLPLEENIFEWQFAIRGPCDTEFEGGIYHGRIQLPAEYPFKPPSFMLLTVMLSILLLAVRTALLALIAFMPTNPNGALGSLDYKKEERRTLAIKSREAAPRFGTPERQKVIDEIHEFMLSKAPPVPELNPSQPSEEHSTDEANQSPQDAGEGSTNPAVGDRIVEEPNEGSCGTTHRRAPVLRPRVQKPADDRLFTLAAVGLTVAIIVLLFKKFMKASGHGAFFMDES
ncbi:hypothetical protein C3L33_14834, partial [Rhododendron williamsianum]